MLIYLLPLLLGLSVCMQSTANGLLASRVGLPLTVLCTSSVVFTCSLAWWWIARFASDTPLERLASPWGYYTGGAWGVLSLPRWVGVALVLGVGTKANAS